MGIYRDQWSQEGARIPFYGMLGVIIYVGAVVLVAIYCH
jgi:hypothetical protein